MSERSGGDWFPWLVVAVLFILLFAYVKVADLDIRDLQRRIATLEQERR